MSCLNSDKYDAYLCRLATVVTGIYVNGGIWITQAGDLLAVWVSYHKDICMGLFDSSHLVNLQILLLSGAEGPWCKCNWFSDPSGLMLTKTATSPLGVASKATVTGFFGSYCLNTWSDIISRMFLYNNLTNSTSDHPLRCYTMEQNRITDFPRSLRSN